jgi:Reverse transcriptase (RNA-dependent DNA polymerase)
LRVLGFLPIPIIYSKMAARRIAAKASKKPSKITPATRTPIPRNRNVRVAVSTGYVQAGSFSPQLPDPLESPTQADPSSDLSLPTFQLTSGIAVMSINPALMSNPPALAENPPVSAENPPVSTAIPPVSTAIPSASAVNLPALAERPALAEIPSTLAPPMTYVSVGEKAPLLEKEPSLAQAKKVTAVLMANGSPFRPIDVVKVENRTAFAEFLMRRFYADNIRRDQCRDWYIWPPRRFCTELLQAIPEMSTTSPHARGFLEHMHELKLHFDIQFRKVEMATDENISAILEKFPDQGEYMQLEACKILIDKLPVDPVNWRLVLKQRILGETPRLITVDDFRFVWLKQLSLIRERVEANKLLDIHPSYGPYSRNMPPQSVANPQSKKRKVEETQPPQKSKCTGCGRGGHIVDTCRFTASPFYNSTNTPYLESKSGREMLKKHPHARWIPSESAHSSTSSSSSASATTSVDSTQPSKKQKGKLLSSIDSSKIDITYSDDVDSDLIPFFVSPVSEQPQPTRRNKVHALLDTGSLAGNFIAFRILKNLSLTHHMYKNSKKMCSVCSGLDNHCRDISDTIDLILSYFCRDLNKYSSFQISAFVLQNTPVDLIIGRKTIQTLDLFSIFPSQIKSKTSSSLSRPLLGHTPDEVVMACRCQPKENLQFSAETPKRLTSTQCSPAATQKRVILASLILESEQLMAEVIADEDEIDDSRNDSFSPWINPFPDTYPLSLIHIAGETDQQNKLRLLCNEFRDIFSNELPVSPANIPPFDLTVDDTKWKVSRNRTPPRPQSAANQADIARQIAVLEKQGIIEKSNAAYYSQVLMVPKPDGTKRMCIDFRNLNDCTEDASWPIPHITEMLRRIGSHKAKIFAVLDLTQGYHQAPLTLAARVYTAFILFCGVYQFTRLPFGPKRAPSYFQQTMATVVLAGLIYIICEMYIDDCNVFAKDIDELVVRHRLIFERFRKHNIFVKANKCFSAMPKSITLAKSYLRKD